jgi:hypothetical protein
MREIKFRGKIEGNWWQTTPDQDDWQQRSTRFMLWWEKANLWVMSAEDAAEAICVEALRIYGYEVVI